MTQTLGKIAADFQTSLAVKMAIGATTGTLQSATDADGVALPTGRYFLTIDRDNSSKEYISCTLTGTALTSIKTMTRQGVETSGTVREHRVGANVIISDFAHIKKINDLLDGTTQFDSGTPLKYGGQPTLSDPLAIPTVQYVLDTATGGTVTFSAQTLAGTGGETIADSNIVYFKESDQRWWKADADVSATFNQVQLGVAQGASSAGAGITVLVSGIASNFTSLTPGSKYYLSNTAGAVTTSSSQTTTVFLGVAQSATELKFYPQTIYWPTKLEKDAITGLSSFTGAIVSSIRRTAPSGFLLCDGTAYSRTDYANLFAAIAPPLVFTVTIASPAVFTSVAHGLVAGDKISLTTSGALPTGLAANTDYYVIATGLTADAFQVSTSLGGSAVNTTGSQSGTHTLYMTNYGKGDGSTTFNVPDMRGMTTYGYKSSDTAFDVLNSPSAYVGAKTHTLVAGEMQHTHSYTTLTNGAAANTPQDLLNSLGAVTSVTATAHNNMPPYVVVNYFIKT